MAQVVWSEPALHVLEQVADCIALADPVAAKKLIRHVFEKINLLEEFPEMCPVPHDLPGSRYRHLIVGPLRIFHRIEKDTAFITYVMRSERDLRHLRV